MTPCERAEALPDDDIEMFLDDIYDTNIDGRPDVVRLYVGKWLTEHVRELLALVNKQAEDEGLWFAASYTTEAYLQSALRELHAAIERCVR